MTPQSFDAITCRHMCGDEQSRKIETQARLDADKNVPLQNILQTATTYWGQCQEEFRHRVYLEAYTKRQNRNKRMILKTFEKQHEPNY